MSPFQHGEVFVTDDGAETDLDLGHYERFTHAQLTQSNNLTSGRIYEQIIARERRGDYLGKTVQVIPHVTNEIKAAMQAKWPQDVDVVIVEIGGTVGDIESLPFLEAIRQMRHEQGRDNCIFVHVTLVPWIAAAQELKTKPTQHSVKELRAIGIQPDILLCRSRALHPAGHEGKDRAVLRRGRGSGGHRARREVGLRSPAGVRRRRRGRDHPAPAASWTPGRATCSRWTAMLERLRESARRSLHRPGGQVRRVRGFLQEPERSAAARRPGAPAARSTFTGSKPRAWTATDWERQLEDYDGILVPGGFGKRGIDGMLNAIRYARESKVPYFGICLGMQTMVIEFARNVCGLERRRFHRVRSRHAASRDLQAARVEGRRRTGRHHAAGRWPCRLAEGSFAHQAYGAREISERHRHRYEFNREYEERLTAAGLRITGETPDGTYVEICEIADHPWFLGCQFHPEFKSKPHGAASAVQGVHRRRLRSTARAPRMAASPSCSRRTVQYSRAD